MSICNYMKNINLATCQPKQEKIIKITLFRKTLFSDPVSLGTPNLTVKKIYFQLIIYDESLKNELKIESFKSSTLFLYLTSSYIKLKNCFLYSIKCGRKW